jgi:hypothetical protein
MDVVPLREFARRIGVSLTAVQKGIKTGRIVAQTDADGRATGIDWDSQGPAWSANSKHPQKKPHNPAGGRPRNDGAPPAPPAQAPSRAPAPAPPPDDGAGKPQMTLAEIQRARELVKLQIDNEKLKEVRGETVSAAEVEKAGRSLAAAVIGGLYGIPDRISDELAGMSEPHAIHALLLQEIDRAVSELRRAYGEH